jgi:flagellar FliL protein
MSEEPAKPAKKKGKGKMMIMIIALVLVVGGAGTAGGLYAAGAFSKHDTGPKIDPNMPQLVLKGENPEEIAAKFSGEAGGDGEAGKGHDEGQGDKPGKGVDLPPPGDPAKYQATYFQVQAPFTSNLTDTDSFAQISIAVATYYDNRVIAAMTTHEMAIRSAILLMLAQQGAESLSTPQGKEALQARLKATINGVLKQKTGFGGIDNVYFTNFVIQ